MKTTTLKSALILCGAAITAIVMASCSENDILDSESSAAVTESAKNLNYRIMAAPTSALVIHNNSDFDILGTINCYGAVQNTSVQDTILIQGPTGLIRSGSSVTYRNFEEQDNGYEIEPWLVTFPSATRPYEYSARDTQEFFGELFDHSDPDSGKFANWEYLKLTLNNYSGAYFTEDVQVFLGLPFFSSDNTGEQVFDLSNYSGTGYLHVHYECGYGADGEISVKIFNEVTDAP